MGPQSGGADLVRLNLEHREMAARGEASLRLPMERGTLPFAAQLARTNQTGPPQPRFLEIHCGEYDLDPGQAFFRGAVTATQLEGSQAAGKLGGERLIVKLAQPGNRPDHFLAESNVWLETAAPGATNGYRRLRSQRLVGEVGPAAKGEFTRLVADQGVLLEEQVVTPKGVTLRTAKGETLTYDVLSDTGELTGGARVETPESIMTSRGLRMHMKTGKISVLSGGYEIEYHPKSK